MLTVESTSSSAICATVALLSASRVAFCQRGSLNRSAVSPVEKNGKVERRGLNSVDTLREELMGSVSFGASVCKSSSGLAADLLFLPS
jgi:hypothetical protein